MTSRTNRSDQDPNRALKETGRSPPLERRRQQAIARYLDSDPIEAICREMQCSKSWLYKWRDRYQADDPAWAQEVSRRPETSPAKLSATLKAEIVRLRQTLSSNRSGPAGATAIRQALEDMAIEPVPSLRTIYRVLHHHKQEVTNSPAMP